MPKLYRSFVLGQIHVLLNDKSLTADRNQILIK